MEMQVENPMICIRYLTTEDVCEIELCSLGPKTKNALKRAEKHMPYLLSSSGKGCVFWANMIVQGK